MLSPSILHLRPIFVLFSQLCLRFHGASFGQVFQPQYGMHLSFPLWVPHALSIIFLDLLTTIVPVENYRSYRHLSLDIRHIKVFVHSSALRMPGVVYLLNCSFRQCDNCLVGRSVCAPLSLCLWHVFLYSEILYATFFLIASSIFSSRRVILTTYERKSFSMTWNIRVTHTVFI